MNGVFKRSRGALLVLGSHHQPQNKQRCFVFTNQLLFLYACLFLPHSCMLFKETRLGLNMKCIILSRKPPHDKNILTIITFNF